MYKIYYKQKIEKKVSQIHNVKYDALYRYNNLKSAIKQIRKNFIKNN